MKEKNPFAPAKVLPLVALILVVVGLFGKFAVADRLAEVARVEAEVEVLRQHKAELELFTAGYNELYLQYAQYSTSWMSEEQQAAVPRLDMLDLVEGELMPGSQVRRLSVSGNILSVELAGITLENTGYFVQKLYQRPDVTNVAVYTASTKDESRNRAAVSLIITMVSPEYVAKKAEQEAAAAAAAELEAMGYGEDWSDGGEAQ